jgi:hypothetical protein
VIAIDKIEGKLTPKHLLRQLEPSLFVNGQTTSLLASDTEKELVSEVRGGMVCMCASVYCRSSWRSCCCCKSVRVREERRGVEVSGWKGGFRRSTNQSAQQKVVTAKLNSKSRCWQCIHAPRGRMYVYIQESRCIQVGT